MATYEYAVVAVGSRRKPGDPAPTRVTLDELAETLTGYGRQGFDVVGTLQTVEAVLDSEEDVGVVILRKTH